MAHMQATKEAHYFFISPTFFSPLTELQITFTILFKVEHALFTPCQQGNMLKAGLIYGSSFCLQLHDV